jgi:carboxypeptidase Q
MPRQARSDRGGAGFTRGKDGNRIAALPSSQGQGLRTTEARMRNDTPSKAQAPRIPGGTLAVCAALLTAGAWCWNAAGQAQPQAQQQPPALPAELILNLEKLRDAALSSDYAWRQAAHLTENIGPRISGSAQAQQAVNYVAEQMRALGLEVKLEKAMVPHWVRGEEHAELTIFPRTFDGAQSRPAGAGAAERTTQKIVLTALGNSAATPKEGLSAEVVAVNSFTELAALGREKVAGRIVLFNEIFDQEMAAAGQALAAYSEAVQYRSRGPQAAAQLGAVAALVRSVGDADYRLPHTGTSIAANIPAAAVTAEDAQLIADLARQGRVVMHLVLTPQTLPPVASYNVISDWKGSQHPEQVVIVSGHLDSWDLGTGAIDDGAGLVMAMQVANLCKQLGLHPARTLRVIAWMDEENGGSGSKAYTAEYQADFANHVAAIEADLGAGHPLGFTGAASPRAAAMLRPVSEVLRKIGAPLLDLDGESGADIEEMGKSGVPVFGLLQDARTYFHYHHTAADTLDKIDPHELAEDAAAVAVLAYALADMPERLPR